MCRDLLDEEIEEKGHLGNFEDKSVVKGMSDQLEDFFGRLGIGRGPNGGGAAQQLEGGGVVRTVAGREGSTATHGGRVRISFPPPPISWIPNQHPLPLPPLHPQEGLLPGLQANEEAGGWLLCRRGG